jgi:hypothetical protein
MADYLYGDSTAFPLSENFLETAKAAAETSVALFRADEIAEEERRLVSEAEQRTMVELIHLGKFARRVEDIYAHAADGLRAHVGSAARNMVGEMHREVLRWRDATVQKAMETAALSQVAPAIGRFFEKNQLPGTSWCVSWRAHDGSGGRTSATVLAKVPGGLEVLFGAAVPKDSIWAKPVRVKTLERGIVVHIMKKRVFRKAAPLPHELDDLYLAEVHPGEERVVLVLRTSAKRTSRGFRISVPFDAVTPAEIVRLGEHGEPSGAVERPSPNDVMSLRRLVAAIDASLREIVPARCELRTAVYRGTPVEQVERPEVLARLLLTSIAPLVQEIARRSNGRGELCLKRTIGNDGRREEIFIPFQALLGGTEALRPEHQVLFDMLGLEDPTIARRIPGLKLPRPLLPPKRPAEPNMHPPLVEIATVAAGELN